MAVKRARDSCVVTAVLSKEVVVDEDRRDPETPAQRDPLAEMRARIEAALDEMRPKIRSAFEELDGKVDAALADIRPRTRNALREFPQTLDDMIGDAQPRLDSLLQRLQDRIEDLRRELEHRAARSAARAGRPVGEIGPGEANPDGGDADEEAGAAGA